MESNTTGSGTDGLFLGSDRRAAYYGGNTLTGVGQTVALFELDGYALSDVQAYFNNVGQSLNVPINNVLLLGASAGSDGIDDTEQVIDIVDAASMAPGLSQVLVYIAPQSGFASGTGDYAIFNRMATDDIAKQISVSWGWKPADPTSDDPIFQQMKADGQNVFAASGDYGAWVSGDFAYPAEDANVTAVGGTELTTNGPGGSWASEIAWGGSNTSCAGYGSGGGISLDNIPIPPYQQLAGVINSSNHGSTTLRNAPDVAAEANCDNYYCANGSCWTSGEQPLGGTSLAAPTWAGYLALVNQQAAANGASSIGFINPLIYPIGLSSSYTNDFHDITSGDNYNSSSPNLYPAVTGYDLVTGWGSANGQNLINALAPTHPATYYATSGNYCENTDPGSDVQWDFILNPTTSDPSTLLAISDYTYQLVTGDCTWTKFAPAGTLASSNTTLTVQYKFIFYSGDGGSAPAGKAEIYSPNIGDVYQRAPDLGSQQTVTYGPTTAHWTIPVGTDLSTIQVEDSVNSGNEPNASMEIDISALYITKN
ncbi:MAG: hypothetical protein ACLQMO_15580 [Acidobacteriaceae bacterium]